MRIPTKIRAKLGHNGGGKPTEASVKPAEAKIGERRSVGETLEDAVEVARVPEVLEAEWRQSGLPLLEIQLPSHLQHLHSFTAAGVGGGGFPLQLPLPHPIAFPDWRENPEFDLFRC